MTSECKYQWTDARRKKCKWTTVNWWWIDGCKYMECAA